VLVLALYRYFLRKTCLCLTETTRATKTQDTQNTFADTYLSQCETYFKTKSESCANLRTSSLLFVLCLHFSWNVVHSFVCFSPWSMDEVSLPCGQIRVYSFQLIDQWLGALVLYFKLGFFQCIGSSMNSAQRRAGACQAETLFCWG
jgi:hypothetical protein